MSSFDDNPFGEPTVDNPFSFRQENLNFMLNDMLQDPSIQQITKKPTNLQEGLEDYNPFADPTSQQRSGTVRGAANPPQYAPGAGPAVMAPSSQDVTGTQPATYSKSNQQNQPPLLTTTELQRRQEELDRKAAELERREQELRRGELNVRRNNWPPLPDNCCWQPCFYLDINVEIQPEFQKIVTQLYKLWQFHTALLLANVIGTLWLNLVSLDIEDVFLSLIYSALYIPLSFLCWFRPGYKAFRDDSSFNFMIFFFIFFFQFLIAVMQGLGFSQGYCGLFLSLRLLRGGTTKEVIVGIIALTIAFGFLAAALADLYLITKIHRIYRSSGASFAKAQQEFTTEFFRNEHVRGAASNMAQAAVRSQFPGGQQQQQQQQPPSNRY